MLDFVGAAASGADTQRLIGEHPEPPRPTADLLLARMVQDAQNRKTTWAARVLAAGGKC